VRCAGFDVHSLPRGKERTKKTRQDVPSWNSLGARKNRARKRPLYFCEVKHIQRLRPHFDRKMRAQKAHAIRHSKTFLLSATHPGQIKFQAKRKAKSLAFSPCRACCQNLKNTLWELNQISSLSLQCGTTGGSQGNAWARFLVTSWGAPRSDIKMLLPNARGATAQGEAVGEWVKNLN
jgi:hypothetical protein